MVRQVIGAGGLARRKLLSLAVITTAIVLAISAVAVAAVKFDGGPGTGAPPSKLDGVSMHKFGKDSRGAVSVGSVSGPTGAVAFSRKVSHRVVGQSWRTWSHHYSGDVYFVRKNSVTLHLPAKTKAFYVYVEPNSFKPATVTAKSGGAGSGGVTVEGNSGAKFFGFVAKGKGHLKSVKIGVSDHKGFAIGEFGIAG
jgi:hypothetical protein